MEGFFISDLDGRIVHISPPYQDLIGRDSAEVFGAIFGEGSLMVSVWRLALAEKRHLTLEVLGASLRATFASDEVIGTFRAAR